MIFLMYQATTEHLNYSKPESKQKSQKHYLQFIFLSHLWPWNKVKVIKPTMKMLTPSKVMIMQNLKDLALTVFEKKATYFFSPKN